MSVSKVLGFIKKADDEFSLIKNDDKIAVGVSGGKDSMVLLYALTLYRHYSRKNYEIIAITIDAGFENMDFSLVHDFCNKNKIEFVIEQSQPNIYKILKMHEKNDKLPCSICAKMKKAAMVIAAKKHHCNKIAYGHHGDDAIETLLLNAIHGGRLATFYPITFLSQNNIYLIRPMIFVYEKDIIRAHNEAKLPLVTSTCKNDKNTQREEVKKMLFNLYKKYPGSQENFLHMLSNVNHVSLWDHKSSFPESNNEEEY